MFNSDSVPELTTIKTIKTAELITNKTPAELTTRKTPAELITNKTPAELTTTKTPAEPTTIWTSAEPPSIWTPTEPTSTPTEHQIGTAMKPKVESTTPTQECHFNKHINADIFFFLLLIYSFCTLSYNILSHIQRTRETKLNKHVGCR